jgi:hypothetical protein
MYPFIHYLYFGILFWLGLYIAQRDWKNSIFKLLSLSLITAAISTAVEIVLFYLPIQLDLYLIYIRDIFWYISVLLLSASLLFHQTRLERKEWGFIKIWSYTVLPLFVVICIGFIWLMKWQAYTLFSQVLSTFCISYFVINTCVAFRLFVRKATTILKKLVLFFALLVFSVSLIMRIIQPEQSFIIFLTPYILSMLVIVLVLYMGVIVDRGEVWVPDLVRSLDYSILLTLVFSGQVALVVALVSTFQLTAALLMLLSISISIATQVFFRYIQAAFDYIAFFTFPKLRMERTRLRTNEEIALIVDGGAEPEKVEEDELVKMTRRALSHFGDLKKLSSNPLTNLKLIDDRLQQRGQSKDLLDRANELKSILLECIEQIKPQQDKGFGVTDEWRFYNSLYFPYVVGIKPYSKKYFNDQLSEEEQQALEWFRVCVPERTFYNWSQTGAQLIAAKIRERSNVHFSHLSEC